MNYYLGNFSLLILSILFQIFIFFFLIFCTLSCDSCFVLCTLSCDFNLCSVRIVANLTLWCFKSTCGMYSTTLNIRLELHMKAIQKLHSCVATELRSAVRSGLPWFAFLIFRVVTEVIFCNSGTNESYFSVSNHYTYVAGQGSELVARQQNFSYIS